MADNVSIRPANSCKMAMHGLILLSGSCINEWIYAVQRQVDTHGESMCVNLASRWLASTKYYYSERYRPSSPVTSASHVSACTRIDTSSNVLAAHSQSDVLHVVLQSRAWPSQRKAYIRSYTPLASTGAIPRAAQTSSLGPRGWPGRQADIPGPTSDCRPSSSCGGC